VPPALHLAKQSFPLQLLFQDAQRLLNIVVANENLQGRTPLWKAMSAAGLPQRPTS
jgi:hypothetical protein